MTEGPRITAERARRAREAARHAYSRARVTAAGRDELIAMADAGTYTHDEINRRGIELETAYMRTQQERTAGHASSDN